MYYMYTRKEAAAYLRISIVTLDRLVKKGEIAYLLIGRRKIFTQAHFEAFLERNSIPLKDNGGTK